MEYAIASFLGMFPNPLDKFSLFPRKEPVSCFFHLVGTSAEMSFDYTDLANSVWCYPFFCERDAAVD